MPSSSLGETPTTPQPVEVWDEHWTAFAIFRACRTQWRVVVLPGSLLYLGLDYPGVEAVMRGLLQPAADRGAVFADIQAMEDEALLVLNEAAP